MSLLISANRWPAIGLSRIFIKHNLAVTKFCVFLFLSAFLTSALAEDGQRGGSTTAQSTPVALEGQIVEIVLALIAILLLIWGIAWFVKRFTGIGPQGGQHIKTIAVMPVGTRERIAVIEIGGRQIVVGITPQQITTLLELDQPLDISPSGGEFARKLQTLLNRNENEAKGEANSVQKQS